MSEETAAPSTAAVAAAPSEAKGKGSLVTKMVILAFMLAVIGGECLVACFYLPSLSAAPATADGKSHDDEHADEHGESDEDAAPRREVDLGKFSITSFQPASNSTLLIDFHMFGTVALDANAATTEAEHSDGGHGGHGGHGDAPPADDEFTRTFEKSKHRIRDQVIVIVRSAEITDFADPSLGLIRRRILEKSNRLLGKPLLEEVIFSDFSIIEQ